MPERRNSTRPVYHPALFSGAAGSAAPELKRGSSAHNGCDCVNRNGGYGSPRVLYRARAAQPNAPERTCNDTREGYPQLSPARGWQQFACCRGPTGGWQKLAEGRVCENSVFKAIVPDTIRPARNQERLPRLWNSNAVIQGLGAVWCSPRCLGSGSLRRPSRTNLGQRLLPTAPTVKVMEDCGRRLPGAHSSCPLRVCVCGVRNGEPWTFLCRRGHNESAANMYEDGCRVVCPSLNSSYCTKHGWVGIVFTACGDVRRPTAPLPG